jgi:drug/metabolite transporter (DMT)-like permease
MTEKTEMTEAQRQFANNDTDKSKNDKKLKIILAFFAVYVIWGSTYLAIRFALESLPPFCLTGVRFCIAGVVMCTWALLAGTKKPTREETFGTLILGILILAIGSSGVVLAERSLSSGLVSLLVTAVPFFIVMIQWLQPGGFHPGAKVLGGLLTGTIGLVLLLGPSKLVNTSAADLGAIASVLIGSMGAASGAVYSRRAKLPSSPQLACGMEMLFAGVLLLLTALGSGEISHLQIARITLKSVWSLIYLIVLGSIVAYSSYHWLLKEVNPAKVASYAYVNPLIAVFLGWLFAGEKVTSATIFGAGFILLAVWLITQSKPKASKEPICWPETS